MRMFLINSDSCRFFYLATNLASTSSIELSLVNVQAIAKQVKSAAVKPFLVLQSMKIDYAKTFEDIKEVNVTKRLLGFRHQIQNHPPSWQHKTVIVSFNLVKCELIRAAYTSKTKKLQFALLRFNSS